jgi:hypothetical protein
MAASGGEGGGEGGAQEGWGQTVVLTKRIRCELPWHGLGCVGPLAPLARRVACLMCVARARCTGLTSHCRLPLAALCSAATPKAPPSLKSSCRTPTMPARQVRTAAQRPISVGHLTSSPFGFVPRRLTTSQ